jgi:hypothetical protein
VVTLAIGLVAFGAGGYAAVRWSPPLAPTRVGRVASLLVALLVAAAVSVMALDVYILIDSLDLPEDFGGDDQVVANSLGRALYEGGTLLGLAAAVHLLAPPPAADQ